MTDIDFLPSRYREQHVQRRKQFWRVVVVAVFFALLLLAGAGQYQRRRSVERLLEFTHQRHESVKATSLRLAELNSQLNELRTQAELIVYLRHPWPRTQVLAALLQPLPASARLDKLSVRREQLAATQVFMPGATPGDPAQIDQRTPAEKELDEMRRRLDGAPTVVLIEGVTGEAAELHGYIGLLADCELFAHAELIALERSESGPQSRSRFTARVVLRPGYGQPGGPTPAAELATDEQAADALAASTPGASGENAP